MERKLVGSIYTAVGLVLMVVSALADSIGVGDGDGFGPKQTAGVIGGNIVILVGLSLLYVRADNVGRSRSSGP
jgi:hypothetical protein